MSTSPQRLARFALVVLGVSLALAGACYEAPQQEGYYRCSEDSECADGGLVCDDTVCCSERGSPLCLGRVLDGGMCADGGTATRYFLDEDGDGFGNLTRPILRCSRTESIHVSLDESIPVVTNSDDCNDTRAAGGRLFFPGAPEQCDGLDNDCDGQFDEGFDGGIYYRDEDGDGFGDTRQPHNLCRPLPGYATAPDDCQPLDPRAYPGAPEECNYKDDDCDGFADEGVKDTWYIDADHDGFGRADMKLLDCQQPDASVSNNLDCNDTNPRIHPDALDVCDGVNNNCNDAGADERPDCGGPENLLLLTSTGERGALDTRANFSGGNPSCLRYWDGGLPESLSANNVWSGSRPTSHVAWFEAPGTWDLTRADNNLAIRFDHRMSGNGSPAWSPHRQPVIILCSQNGFARYVPAMDGGVNPLMPYAGIEVNTVLPIGRGSAGGWVERSNALDLRRVKRVEILIEPSDAGTPNVSFDVNFIKLGFQ
jgi:hypothetical protein